ncbi:uncharacterized protein LOC142976871 [Anticarsia gemmatalis]|uniref:uncharacterized protein LOC142976871 n=1 Tax=Anticarsia gemmatalis TaxID=129554 RepID=UPI003F770BEB
MGCQLDCCYDRNLKAGALLIAFLTSVVSSIHAILSVFLWIYYGLVVSALVYGNIDHVQSEESRSFMNGFEYVMKTILNLEDYEVYSFEKAFLLVVTIAHFFMYLPHMKLIFTFVLIKGVYQRKRGNLQAYLIFNTIYMILFAIMVVYAMAIAAKMSSSQNVNAVVFVLCLSIPSVFVDAYSMVIISCYHSTMIE